MGKTVNYRLKFNSFRNKTLFGKLEDEQQAFIEEISFKLKLTFQEFHQVVLAARDLGMWGEGGLKSWWDKNAAEFDFSSVNEKKKILMQLQTYLHQLRINEKNYSDVSFFKPAYRKQNKIISKTTDKNIIGMCPVASEKTVCCNLHTIDAVENCVFGCSYCTIQTFYGRDILIQ
jgi:spore photoproduct lyase